MRSLFVAALLVLPFAASAQGGLPIKPRSIDDCRLLPVPEQRLECFDLFGGQRPAPGAAGARQAPASAAPPVQSVPAAAPVAGSAAPVAAAPRTYSRSSSARRAPVVSIRPQITIARASKPRRSASRSSRKRR